MKRRINVKGTPEENFWELNPEFRYVEEFHELKEEYEDISSSIMWSIYLIEHPRSELFHSMSRKERRDHVVKTMGIKDIWGDHLIESAIKRFKRMCMTKAEYALHVVGKKMDVLVEIMDEAEDGPGNFELLKSYLKDYSEIQTLYEQSVRSLNEAGDLRSGQIEGASESGELFD